MSAHTQMLLCARCGHEIPPLTEHIRMTIQMTAGQPDTRRYCMTCSLDPELAVLLSDVRNNPVKCIEIFVCYR